MFWSLNPSLATLAVMAVAAAGALWWAWRGWLRTTPPSCRACGYDVSGRPPDSTRCSECGADLAPDGAIVTAFRRRRWAWAAVAGVVLATACATAIDGGRRLPWKDWFVARAPLWCIERFARRDHSVTGDVYRSEWRRRTGVTSAFLDHLLDVQLDSPMPFAGAWDADLCDAYEPRGAMNDGQRDRYLHQTFGPPATITVRNPVRAGDPLHVALDWPTRGRFGDRWSLKTTYAARADGPATVTDRNWASGFFAAAGSRDLPNRDWAGGAPLVPGVHRVSVVVRRVVIDNRSNALTPPVEAAAELAVHVLPATAPLGTPIYDPTVAVAVGAGTDVHAYHWGDGRVFVTVQPSAVTVDRAYTVYAVIDGRERPIGTQALAAGADYFGEFTFHVPVDATAAAAMRTLTIVLVGDGDALKTANGQQRYWAGRVTYPDVPLEPFANFGVNTQHALRPTTRRVHVEPSTAPAAGR
jgi:hypothetical protein